MQWNIFFTLRGPGGQVEVPNKFNPVDAANLDSVLSTLSTNLPRGLGVEPVGVRIVPADGVPSTVPPR